MVALRSMSAIKKKRGCQANSSQKNIPGDSTLTRTGPGRVEDDIRGILKVFFKNGDLTLEDLLERYKRFSPRQSESLQLLVDEVQQMVIIAGI